MALFKKMFDQTREGKGVLKTELSEKFTLLKFFRLTKRKFWRICALNIFFILTNLPIFALLFYAAGYGTVAAKTPLSIWFGPIHGAMEYAEGPAAALLYSLCGITIDGSYPGTWSYILLGIACLTLLTFGFSNVGMAYMLRNYTREEPCDFKDYFITIKKNWRQALILGIFDGIIITSIVLNLYLLLFGQGPSAFLAVIGAAAGAIYLMMRNYFYVIMITFNLSIIKIVKNSLIFAFVNVKRNLAGFFASALCWITTAAFVFFVTPLGAVVLFGLIFSFTSFVGVYCAYPAIKQYMIDPIIDEERKKRKEQKVEEKESIFTDMG